MPHHQIVQHFPPSTYALLRALSVAPCGLLVMKYLCLVVDSVRGVGHDQCAVRMPFDCLFNMLFSFV